MSITNKALEARFVTGTDVSWYHSSYSVFKSRYGSLDLIVHSENYDEGGWIFWESNFSGDSLQDLVTQIRDDWFRVDTADRSEAASIHGLTLSEADYMVTQTEDPCMIAGLLHECGSGYLFGPYFVQYAQSDREFLLSVTGYDN